MPNIFIIYRCELGNLPELVMSFTDKAKADAFVQGREQHDEQMAAWKLKLDGFDKSYEPSHPQPPYSAHKLIREPKWSGTIGKMPDDVKAERSRIQESNATVTREHDALMVTWRAAFDLARKQFLSSLGVPEKDHSVLMDSFAVELDPLKYRIEPVQLIT